MGDGTKMKKAEKVQELLVSIPAAEPQQEPFSKSLPLTVLNELNENNSNVIMYVKLRL